MCVVAIRLRNAIKKIIIILNKLNIRFASFSYFELMVIAYSKAGL